MINRNRSLEGRSLEDFDPKTNHASPIDLGRMIGSGAIKQNDSTKDNYHSFGINQQNQGVAHEQQKMAKISPIMQNQELEDH